MFIVDDFFGLELLPVENFLHMDTWANAWLIEPKAANQTP
jgi:hypothetical protein